MKRFIIISIAATFWSCSYKKVKLVFYVPNTIKIEQQNIVDVSQVYNVSYGQYLGFYFLNKDSIFNKILFITKDQDAVEADIASSEKQEQIKRGMITKLRTQYRLKGNETKESVFKVIRTYFKEFNISTTETSIKIFNFCGNVIAIANYYNNIIPNVIVEIFPAKSSCIEKQ